MEPYYESERAVVHHGDCLDVLRELPDASVDAVVTDPPYGLEFMGREWDAPWQRGTDVNADAGFKGGGIDATKSLPSFTGSTNPKCLTCKGTRRGRRDGTAKVAVCLCEDGGRFPNHRATEMAAFQAWCEQWAAECLRVLKPGGHMLAFGGTRTWHRLACAIEDAGFEIRDNLAWLYGSGFPKSLDVSKAIDKAAGAERKVVGHADPSSPRTAMARKMYGTDMQEGTGVGVPLTAPATPDAARWQGWGTALKPAYEPIVLARKPLAGTVAANVLAHGTGALNVDGCRIPTSESDKAAINAKHAGMSVDEYERRAGSSLNLSTNPMPLKAAEAHVAGRWPANVVLDEAAAAMLDEQSGTSQSRMGKPRGANPGDGWGMTATGSEYDDLGGASRFFYTAKAGSGERPRDGATAHPTVKPLDLMRWLVRLVTPPGGTVLEPFAGSGATVEACILEGFRCVAIERETDYLPLVLQRIQRRLDPVSHHVSTRSADDEPSLFDLLAGEGGAA